MGRNDTVRRVLFVAHSPRRGGAEYCLQTILEHFDRVRYEPVVVFPEAGPMADAARHAGCDVHIAPMCHWLYFKKDAWFWKNLVCTHLANVNRLCAIIRSTKSEIVYTNSTAIFEPSLAARRCRVPHIWHIHEVLKDGNQMCQLLPLSVMKRFIQRSSDALIFESYSSRAIFGKTSASEHSHVVYNSLRLTVESTQRSLAADRENLGFGIKDRLVGFVGSFIERKDPLLLIDALTRVRGVDGLRCIFVGDGPLLPVMRQRIAERSLGHICRILPFQVDIGAVMNAIDVLILPSRQESFGLVTLEAAAFGRPTIACRSQGPCETIVDGETGFLIGQGSEQELASKIEDMFSGQTQSRLGLAAARRVRDRFDATTNTRSIEAIISAVLQRSANSLATRRMP